ALRGEEVDLVQHDGDVLALLFQARPSPLELAQEFLELLALVPRDIVQLEQLADLRKRESQALAPQGKLEADPVAAAEDPGGAFPAGADQPLVLVEADRACGHFELRGELGYRISFRHCAMQQP